jgi:putrescine transport system substrate-binding protein
MEKLAKCGVTFLDSPDEMFSFAMIYAGMDPNSNKRADFKPSSPAVKALKAVRPHIKQFTSSQYINDLANGDSCVAVGFSGDIFQASARAEEANNGIEVAYSIPKEGTEIWFDMLLIPVDAKNAENAHKFINYLMRPDVIAEITDYVWYANPNKDATRLIDQEIALNPAIYPTQETKKNLFISEQVTPKIAKIRNRVWSDLKAGR